MTVRLSCRMERVVHWTRCLPPPQQTGRQTSVTVAWLHALWPRCAADDRRTQVHANEGPTCAPVIDMLLCPRGWVNALTATADDIRGGWSLKCKYVRRRTYSPHSGAGCVLTPPNGWLHALTATAACLWEDGIDGCKFIVEGRSECPRAVLVVSAIWKIAPLFATCSCRRRVTLQRVHDTFIWKHVSRA